MQVVANTPLDPESFKLDTHLQQPTFSLKGFLLMSQWRYNFQNLCGEFQQLATFNKMGGLVVPLPVFKILKQKIRVLIKWQLSQFLFKVTY